MATIREEAEVALKTANIESFINMASAYGPNAHSYVLGALDALRWMKKIPPVATVDLCGFTENPAERPQPHSV